MSAKKNRLQLQKPKKIGIDYLQEITERFSPELIIGRGGFGTVYKGKKENGEFIAVKMLNQTETAQINDTQFKTEVLNVMHISHPNIVRLEGYCINNDEELITHKGTHLFAEKHNRLICFEYLPGSLQEYLSNEDKCRVPNWNECHNIIKGICKGLHYLHEGQGGKHILHLDLKPANVLLDKNMIPKIADFGQSRLRLLNEGQTRTTKLVGTCGYMAPEHIRHGVLSKETDVYSLGVIIMEIIAGKRKYPDEQLDEVREKWKETSGSEEYEQIEKCIKLALDCMEEEPEKRPDMRQVIEILGISEDDMNHHPDGIEEHSVVDIDSSDVDPLLEERHGLLRRCTMTLESATTTAVTVIRTRLQRMKNSAFLSGVHIPIIGLVLGGILFSVLIYSVGPYIVPSSYAKSRTVSITVEEASFTFAVAISSPAVLTYNFSARMDIYYVYGSYRPSATKLFDVYFSFGGQRFHVADRSLPTALSSTLVMGPLSGNVMVGTAAVDEYLKAANKTPSIEVQLLVLAEVMYDDPALTVCSLVATCPFELPLWTIGLETTFYDVKCTLDMGWSSTKDTTITVISKPTFVVRGRSKRGDVIRGRSKRG